MEDKGREVFDNLSFVQNGHSVEFWKNVRQRALLAEALAAACRVLPLHRECLCREDQRRSDPRELG
jgi:hypothetical protein